MKIAIATQAGMVSQHFGCAETFTVFDIENKVVVGKNEVANPGHRPGFLPVFLARRGVGIIIAGGIGSGAVDLFKANGIEVITGASGNPDAVIEQLLSGDLKSTGIPCSDHLHHGEC